MSMVAVAIGGSALLGAGAGIYEGNKAAGAQESAANSAIGEQQREFNLTQQNNAPFVQAGQNAVNLQQQYLSGDTSGFDKAPDYQFAVQQGTKQLDAGAAAHGNLFGGGADADRIALGQGLATQYANNYWNKLSGMAGQGQTANAQVASAGQSTANNIGNYTLGAGQARASSYANAANSIGNLTNQFSNMYGQGLFNQASAPGNLGSTNYLGQFNSSFPALNSGTYNLATAGTGGGRIMGNFYDVAQAIQQPNPVGNFNQGVQTAQRNNLYNEQQQVFQQAQTKQANLQNLAPQVIAGDPSAFAQAAAIDPQAAAQYQGAGDQQLTRLRGALNYLNQARQTGNPTAIDAAWQQAKPFLSQIAGKPAPDHWDPSFEGGLDQAMAKISQLPAQSSNFINVAAGGALVDPITGKPVYTNPGTQKPMQLTTIPDGKGGTIQGFADPVTGQIKPASYGGTPQSGGMPQAGASQPAYQTTITPAMPSSAPVGASSITAASPVNVNAVAQANALLAQGMSHDDVMRQIVQANPSQQFSMIVNPQTGQFEQAPDAAQPSSSAPVAAPGQLGYTPPKASADDTFAKNKAFADQLKASGAITTPEQYNQVLNNGKLGSGFQGNVEVAPLGDPTKSGADYLASLPVGSSEIVKGLLNGTTALPTGTALKNGFWQSALASALHADPSWNQAGYAQYANTRKYFTTGAGGQLINNINTASTHMGKLVDDIQALNNGSLRPLNWLGNEASAATGGQAVTNFNADLTPVASELAAVYKGKGVPSDAEIASFKNALTPNMSYGQQMNIVRGWVQLLTGKLNAQHQQYQQSMSKLSDPLNVINPEANSALQNITGLANKVSNTGQHPMIQEDRTPVYAPGQQAAPQAGSTPDYSHLWGGSQ